MLEGLYTAYDDFTQQLSPLSHGHAKPLHDRSPEGEQHFHRVFFAFKYYVVVSVKLWSGRVLISQ